MKNEAVVSITGFQFSKNGVALNFIADTNNDQVIMKGRNADLPLTVGECGQLIQVLKNVLDAVISNVEQKELVNKSKIDFGNLPEI